jgi:hypothetical protein
VSTDKTVPYSGPIPSPASGLARWAMIVSGFAALGNAVQLFLNLVERHLQQNVVAGTPPPTWRIRETLTRLQTADRLTFLAAAAYLVVGLTWARRRRPRARLRQEGEYAVEPRLWTVAPAPYVATLGLVLLSIVTAFLARSALHASVTHQDIVAYRTYRAMANLFRALMWTSWVGVIVGATKAQDRREAATVSGNDAGRPVVGLDL